MNLFFTNTPYHVLLSYALASESEFNHLIASGEEPGRKLINTISSHSSSPFECTTVLPAKQHDNRLFRSLERRQNLRTIREYIIKLDTDVEDIYVFHKGSTEAQSIFYFADEYCSGYKTGFYVEDGIEAYSTHEFEHKPLPFVVLGKLVYGQWWEDIQPLYSSKYIQAVRATFPQYLRPELQELPAQAISPDPLLSDDMAAIVHEYFNTLDIDVPGDVTHLLVAPHSSLAQEHPELVAKMEKAVSDITNSGKLAIKYHPRDQSNEYFNLDGHIISTEIPLETVYISNPGIECVVGGRSTAVMTAKWLTDADVLSVYSELETTDTLIQETLNSIGIQRIESKRDPK